jgi:hypothetical protein
LLHCSAAGEMQEERPRSNDQTIDCGGHVAVLTWSMPAVASSAVASGLAFAALRCT